MKFLKIIYARLVDYLFNGIKWGIQSLIKEVQPGYTVCISINGGSSLGDIYLPMVPRIGEYLIVSNAWDGHDFEGLVDEVDWDVEFSHNKYSNRTSIIVGINLVNTEYSNA